MVISLLKIPYLRTCGWFWTTLLTFHRDTSVGILACDLTPFFIDYIISSDTHTRTNTHTHTRTHTHTHTYTHQSQGPICPCVLIA